MDVSDEFERQVGRDSLVAAWIISLTGESEEKLPMCMVADVIIESEDTDI